MKQILSARWLLLSTFLVMFPITLGAGYHHGFSKPSESSNQVNPVEMRGNHQRRQFVRIKKEGYVCPQGFVRIRKGCYYISHQQFPWQQAHFACKRQGARLAHLDTKEKDRGLRRYLNHTEPGNQLERWIGGIYNWQQGQWQWGSSGAVLDYKGFAKRSPRGGKNWHCIAINPRNRYRWKSASCMKPKGFICETGFLSRKKWHQKPQNITSREGATRRRKTIEEGLRVERNDVEKPADPLRFKIYKNFKSFKHLSV